MGYKVVVTSDAEKDFDRFIQYLLFEKKNVQAAQSVLNDFEATKKSLAQVEKMWLPVSVRVFHSNHLK